MDDKVVEVPTDLKIIKMSKTKGKGTTYTVDQSTLVNIIKQLKCA